MSQTLDIPDGIFDALRKVAEAGGTTPVEWIAARLVEAQAVVAEMPDPEPGRTLADLFAGRVGRVRGQGPPRISGREGEDFADYLEEKRRRGCL